MAFFRVTKPKLDDIWCQQCGIEDDLIKTGEVVKHGTTYDVIYCHSCNNMFNEYAKDCDRRMRAIAGKYRLEAIDSEFLGYYYKTCIKCHTWSNTDYMHTMENGMYCGKCLLKQYELEMDPELHSCALCDEITWGGYEYCEKHNTEYEELKKYALKVMLPAPGLTDNLNWYGGPEEDE